MILFIFTNNILGREAEKYRLAILFSPSLI